MAKDTSAETNATSIAGPARRVGPIGISLLTVFFIIFACLLICGLVQFWPATAADGSPPGKAPVRFLTSEFSVSGEVRLIVIVVLSGALGGTVHALRSLYWYVGNGRNL